MGGGPARELLLCTLPIPEPTATLAHLRSTFPWLDIRFVQVSSTDDPTVLIPPSVWAATTILCTLFTFPPPDLAAVPHLQLVHLISAGSNQIAHHPLYTHSAIPLTTSSGIHGPQIAEWLLLTRLVVSHRYHALHALQRGHRWGTKGVAERGSKTGGTEEVRAERGHEEENADFRNVRDQVGGRVGILGYGSIGRQVGRVARAMGMEVVAFTATPKTTPEARRDRGFIVPGTGDPEGTVPVEWYSGLGKEELRGFLGQRLDWLVISVPLTDQTRGFLGTEEWKALSDGGKREVFVSNIARGAIVKQEELIAALKDGTLAGAALDVTDPEPLPSDSELWDLKNVIVTPHVAGVGSSYVERTFQVLEENLRRREKGEKLLNVVQRERGY